MSNERKIGPWPVGLDNVAPQGGADVDRYGRFVAAREALNVDFDVDGWPSSRVGRVLGLAGQNMHSGWSCSMGAFAMDGSMLCRATTNGTTVTLTPAIDMGSAERVYYAELNGTIIASNKTSIVEIGPTWARPLGVDDGFAPHVVSAAGGGLPAGRYGVAISYVRNGREGALSSICTAEVADGGGLQMTGITAPLGIDLIRVYRTNRGGDVLYVATELSPFATTAMIGNGPLGREGPNERLTRMVPGDHLAVWHGRALLARGRNLYFSHPLLYHLCSRRHSFVQAPRRITMIVAVEGGVFIGQPDGVLFLSGDGPKQWRMIRQGTHAPIAGAYGSINGSDLTGEYQLGGQQCAIWLTRAGYAIGAPQGGVIEAQSDRIEIPAAREGSLLIDAQRVTTTVR